MDKKPTILIIDDDPKFRKALSDILRIQGYAPIAAAKGKTALDRVKEEMPAVALIDLKLPDMDGLKMMREIKKRSPDTECIVLTGYASQASAIEAVNLGVYAYVEKPYDVEQLVLTIHRAIEKRAREEALRQSEERYGTILDDIEDGYFEVDIAGNFTFFNDSLCRIIGYSRDEMMGMNNRQYMDKENAKKVFQAFNRVYTTGKPTKGFDWEIIRKDGTRRFVEASASPIRGSEGEPIGFRGIVRDITERKRAEEEIRRRSAYLATLLRINATLRSTLPLSQVLETIVQGTAEALGYLGSFIAIPDATGERLTLGAAWGGRVVDAALRVTRFKLESFSVPVKAQENIIARAFVTGELQTSSGEPEGMAVGTEPPIGAKIAKVIERIAGARGVACVPLRVAEKTVGVLIVVSPREQLADEERAMLLGLADQAGLAIENARLYEETRHEAEELAALYDVSLDIAAQLEIQELLQTILERAIRLLNARGGGIYLYDPAGREIELRASHGYFTKDYIGTRLALGEGLSGKVAQTGEPLLVKDYAHWEGRSLKWDGEPSVTVLGVPLKRGDELLGVLFINHEVEKGFDEGEIRLATLFANQAAIAIENARLFETVVRGKKEWEETFDSVSDGVYLIDSNWTIMRTNRALAESFGTTPQELIGRKCYEVIHGFDEPWSECPLREVLETKQPVIREAENPPTGRTLQLSVYPRLDDKGNAVGSVHVVGDITERRRREKEVQRRNRELAALNAIAATVSGSLDLKEVLHQALDKVFEITGFEAGGFGLVDEAREVIVPTVYRGAPQDFLATFAQPRAGDGLRWQSVKSGEAFFFENLPHDPRVRGREALIKGFRAGAYLPLKVKDKSMGLMALGTGHDHHFSSEEKSLLMTIASQIAIAIDNAQAYERLKIQNLETISALAAAVEAKDPYTSGHSEKVTQFAITIAEKMGLSHDEIEDLRVAGLLHDIGKIGIPDSVLNKPARLTPAEFLMVKTHSAISAEIVERIEALAPIVPIIRHHHERWDGTGYPDGLKGEDIPLLARILAVADGFEAMTSERPYRRARTEEEALAELKKGAGSQWDPQVVEVFVKIYEERAPKH